MVVPVPIPPPPPLLEQDLTLLAAFCDPSADPWAAAAKLGLSEHDLTAWFARPDIQHWLTLRRQIRLERLDIIIAHATGEALQALREVVRERNDPVETRRAATLLLRIARGSMGFPAHVYPPSTNPPSLPCSFNSVPSPIPLNDLRRLTGLHLTKPNDPSPPTLPTPNSASHTSSRLFCPTTAAFEEALGILRARGMTTDADNDAAEDADLDDAADTIDNADPSAAAHAPPSPTPNDSS